MIRPPLVLFAAVVSVLALPLLARSQAGAPPPRLPSGGTRGPAALQFSSDGKLLYVVEQDEALVEVLDPSSGAVLASIPTGGKQPTSIAVSPDGQTALVANSLSGSVAILDLATRTLRSSVPLPGGPRSVVWARPDTAFVSLEQLDAVAVLDPRSGSITKTIPVAAMAQRDGAPWLLSNTPAGRRPGAMALTPDGKTLVCATLSGGAISLIDTESLREKHWLRIPAVNLRGIALSRSGDTAYVTAQQPNEARTTGRPEETWSNGVWVVELGGERSRVGRMIPLDTNEDGAADPSGVVMDSDGESLFVSLSGAHGLAQVKLGGRGGSLHRVPVGVNPRSVTVRPGSGEVWVANHLGSSLSVLSGDELQQVRTVTLKPATRPDLRLRGRFLFSSGHLARGERFTCNSCHPDGGTDGLAWKFSHLKDGVERRNSRSIRGDVLLTAPYRWSGKEQDFEDFVNDEIVGFFGKPKLGHNDLHALWDLANDFPQPANPHRAAMGAFTPRAERGRQLFAGRAACSSCHAGTQAGGTGKREAVGTTPTGLKLDVPHLSAVFDSAPYLHDGRASSLEAIFSEHNESKLHGKAHLLSEMELGDLLQFVREL